MDINSITSKSELSMPAAKGFRLEQISELSKTLGLKPGSQFLAQVEKITQLNQTDRAELLTNINNQLAQLNKVPATAAVKLIIAQLLEQKALIQQSNTKLVDLQVTNPLKFNGDTPLTSKLLSYTSASMSAGQTLVMQITPEQRLQLVQSVTPELHSKLINLINALQQTQKALPASLNEALNSLARSAPSAAANGKAQSIISEQLRQLLPHKDKSPELLASLPKVLEFVHKLAPSARSEWLSSELQGALKTLSNQIKLSNQLTSPTLLAQSFNNNGQRFEQKLAQALNLSTTERPTHSATAGATSASPNSSSTTTTHANISTNSGIKPIGQTGIDKIIAQDLKAALLGVLHKTQRELSLPALSASLEPSALAASALKPSGAGLAVALPQLLAFIMQKSGAELSQKQLRTQLVMLLHQATLGSLAKIQLQQLHSLSHQLSQTDQPLPTQSWQLEIPVRQGQEVHPLQIQLEQQWVEDSEQSNSKEAKRSRQWNVMLSFELVDFGRFYTQLGLLGERLSVKFWAEQEHTLAQLQARLQPLKKQLEQEGLEITQLQCLAGAPPSTKISLNYALVDVKT